MQYIGERRIKVSRGKLEGRLRLQRKQEGRRWGGYITIRVSGEGRRQSREGENRGQVLGRLR